MYYLTTHSTHFIYGYMASVCDVSMKDNEKHQENIFAERFYTIPVNEKIKRPKCQIFEIFNIKYHY